MFFLTFEETTDHLFMSCHFTRQVWSEVEFHLQVMNLWDMDCLLDCFVWFLGEKTKLGNNFVTNHFFLYNFQILGREKSQHIFLAESCNISRMIN